jgi:hypothetical protein
MAASSGTLATALVEFRSVVGAVRCAIEGQNAKAANDRSGSKNEPARAGERLRAAR